MRATRPRARRGSSGRSGSRSCRAEASRTPRGSSRRRTSSASGPGRSTSSRPVGSCARPQPLSPRGCRRRTSARGPCGSLSATSPASTASPRRSRAPGYERVDRVEERGQFAVRGGIVDVFPSTGREPLRIELFGDEIEQVRAFSPFTQRALHAVTQATVYPAAERRAELIDLEAAHAWEEDEAANAITAGPRRPRRPARSRARLRLAAGRRRRSGRRRASSRSRSTSATELDPFPRGQAFQFEAQRPAIAARGLAEAENELAGFVRSGNRVVVTFPHRGEALRQGGLLRKVESRRSRRRGSRCRGRPPCASPSPRRGAASSGATSASSSCPTRRSSASGRRGPTRASAARSRRSPISASATTSSTRTTASASCSASRRRRSRASPATTSSSRSAATTVSTSRTSSSASSPATSAPTRRSLRSRSSAARRGRT